MGKVKNILGEDLDPKAAAFPCGLIAKTYFNDEFKIDKLEIITENIAWPDDKKYRFKNSSDKSK